MVIDSSALIAILREEPEAIAMENAIRVDPTRLMSAVTKLEASIVTIGRRDRSAVDVLDRLIAVYGIIIVPFDDHHAIIARDAFIRYGKGRHPAALNFGDCASYALAIAEAEPLLFKGTDFGATDVRVVEQR